MGSDSVVSSGLGGEHRPGARLGSAYHMDPLLLAIQVSELVWADVDQRAQVTVISAEKKKWGVAQARVAHIPWPSPNNSLPTSGASGQANVTQPPKS